MGPMGRGKEICDGRRAGQRAMNCTNPTHLQPCSIEGCSARIDEVRHVEVRILVELDGPIPILDVATNVERCLTGLRDLKGGYRCEVVRTTLVGKKPSGT